LAVAWGRILLGLQNRETLLPGEKELPNSVIIELINCLIFKTAGIDELAAQVKTQKKMDAPARLSL